MQESSEPVDVSITPELVADVEEGNGSPEEARVRLEEVLEAFDPTGKLASDLDGVLHALREVAFASAESPLLDPLAGRLGDHPRVALPSADGAPSRDALPQADSGAELLDSAAGVLLGMVSALSASVGSVAEAAGMSAFSSPGSTPATAAALASATQPAATSAGPGPSVEWSAQTVRPTQPLMTPAQAPALTAASAGTFDTAPWLMAPNAGEGSLGEPAAALKATPTMPSGPVVAAEGVVDVSAESSMARATEGARSPAAAARTVQARALAPNVLATAPEVPVMPGEKPITRLNARVSDGKRVLDVGVSRESDGYAVEVRAPRDFVADIREMEGDIDAALRDDGGDGLASFDASSEDEYAAPEAESREAPSVVADESEPSSDPSRMLDRRV
jgi:hypothetical protein